MTKKINMKEVEGYNVVVSNKALGMLSELTGMDDAQNAEVIEEALKHYMVTQDLEELPAEFAFYVKCGLADLRFGTDLSLSYCELMERRDNE